MAPPSSPRGAPTGIPLARLFAMAYYHFVDSLHTRLAELGWDDVRPAYGFVLLAAREGALTPTDVGVLMGTTKQAASVLTTGMERAGYLAAAPSLEDARVKTLTLTPRARELLSVVEQIYVDLESEWAEVVGAERLEQLRTDLHSALLASHGGLLPGIRPTK